MNLEEEIRKLQMQVNDLRIRTGNMNNAHGWINGAWQKAGMPLNFSSVLRDRQSNTNLNAGTNQLDSATVPAGEIWVVTQIVYRYIGTVSSCSLFVSINDGSTDTYLENVNSGTVTSALLYKVNGAGPVILSPGEKIRLTIFSATATDDAGLYISGYKVDIDQ